MNYNSEGLSDYARRIADIGGIASIDLMHFAVAWDEEVSALKKDKAELRELCKLLNVDGPNKRSEAANNPKGVDCKIRNLWDKHIEGKG